MAKQKTSKKSAPKKSVTVKSKVKKKVTGKSKKASKAKPKSTKKVIKKTLTKKASAKAASKKKPVAKGKASKVKKIKKPALAKKAVKKVSPAVKPMPSKLSPSQVEQIKKIVPLDNRLVVEVSETEKMTAGGLYIPATVSDVSGNKKGSVLFVGRGHLSDKGHLLAMDVKVGDQVLFSDHAGIALKLNEKNVVVLRETEVLGIVAK